LTEIDSDLIARIRMEYTEMPGLALTRAQATRLWYLEASVCERVLQHLVRERFLAELRGGRFLRLTSAPAAR
jgi:hypothetical protein